MKRLLALIVVLTTGCGSSVVPSGSPANPVPPVASTQLAPNEAPATAQISLPSTAPTPIRPRTVAYAAKVYLAVASRFNKFDRAAWVKLPKNPTLSQYRGYYKTHAALLRDFDDRLRSRVWPTEAAADVKLLLRKHAETALYALTLSKVKTFADFDHFYSTYEKLAFQSSGIANAVRTDLGLDPVPVQ